MVIFHGELLNNQMAKPTGWDPQDSVQLPYKWLKTMVYGRYNELVTSSWGLFHGL